MGDESAQAGAAVVSADSEVASIAAASVIPGQLVQLEVPLPGPGPASESEAAATQYAKGHARLLEV
jgi:hypothetical protein